jgi:hypothetical protein
MVVEEARCEPAALTPRQLSMPSAIVASGVWKP